MSKLAAWLQFGGSHTIEPQGPYRTVQTEVKETETPRSGQTVTGYGSRLPSPYMVKHNGRWRRVYFACYGNASSAYIGKPGAWLAVVDISRA